MYIAIEGNAGTGKTILAKALARALGMSVALEPAEDELAPLYRQVDCSALRIQTYCLAHRLLQQQRISVERGTRGVVSDFVLRKDRVYAETWLSADDFAAYERLFEAVQSLAQTPDQLVYLVAPSDFLLERIRRRGRSFERFIDAACLDKIEALLQKHVFPLKSPNTVVLRATDFDVRAGDADLSLVLKRLGYPQ